LLANAVRGHDTSLDGLHRDLSVTRDRLRHFARVVLFAHDDDHPGLPLGWPGRARTR